MTKTLTPKNLLYIAPHVYGDKAKLQQTIITACSHYLPQAIKIAELSNTLRLTHFLAQIAHESDGFCTTCEYASGAAYEGRKDLGNIYAGDGMRFKGRGLIQITGRNNYNLFNRWASQHGLQKGFITNPQLVTTFPAALFSAVWFWQSHNLNRYADNDDLENITKQINGGLNGYKARANYLSKAKQILAPLAIEHPDIDMFYTSFIPLIRQGDKGKQVKSLQSKLSQLGHFRSSIDGIFGTNTLTALKDFQKKNQLAPDGIAGQDVLKSLAQKIGATYG